MLGLAFDIIPTICVIGFFVVFFIVIISALKISRSQHKNIFNDVEKDFKQLGEKAKTILSNNIFNMDETIICEYCSSQLPKGTTKCPHCSASVKKTKQN